MIIRSLYALYYIYYMYIYIYIWKSKKCTVHECLDHWGGSSQSFPIKILTLDFKPSLPWLSLFQDRCCPRPQRSGPDPGGSLKMYHPYASLRVRSYSYKGTISCCSFCVGTSEKWNIAKLVNKSYIITHQSFEWRILFSWSPKPSKVTWETSKIFPQLKAYGLVGDV